MVSRIREIERRYDCLLPNGAVINEIRRRFDFSTGSSISNNDLGAELEKAVNNYLHEEF
jgi:hypothetical protein